MRFAGFISSKELLFGLIALSQLYVFPTTYEAMAITLLEVAALRIPLVASDIPENRVVLPEHALFFRSADVADLRARIEWALGQRTDPPADRTPFVVQFGCTGAPPGRPATNERQFVTESCYCRLLNSLRKRAEEQSILWS